MIACETVHLHRGLYMKIVFLSYLHGFGGAEKQIVNLSNEMAKRGHAVSLISISVDNNCYKLDDRVEYYYIPDEKTGWQRILSRYKSLKKALKTIKPDITVSFWYQSAYLTSLMKKSITGRIIYSERGDPGDKEYSGALGLVRKLTLPFIDGFVFQSKGAQEFFSRNVQKRSVVIHNPVFIAENFPEVTKRRRAIVTVGRLHPQKNQKLLIDAFADITSCFPDYSLEIYGEGGLKDELNNQIESLGLNNKVFLKGTSQHIYSLIYDAALFVLSSDYEGLPNTLLEAMSLGIPSISTDCKPGGVREIIDNNINGIITPIGNKELLVSAIKRILSDDKIGASFSIEGKKKMTSFSPDIVYSRWEQFFNHVLLGE
ncbi:MAG: glycosyltransferase [Oscillospiraceae bacterium]|nr:glycosyltransferase [Oscillospiraceae bacterium]